MKSMGKRTAEALSSPLRYHSLGKVVIPARKCHSREKVVIPAEAGIYGMSRTTRPAKRIYVYLKFCLIICEKGGILKCIKHPGSGT
jgi:hypothetical protein